MKGGEQTMEKERRLCAAKKSSSPKSVAGRRQRNQPKDRQGRESQDAEEGRQARIKKKIELKKLREQFAIVLTALSARRSASPPTSRPKSSMTRVARISQWMTDVDDYLYPRDAGHLRSGHGVSDAVDCIGWSRGSPRSVPACQTPRAVLARRAFDFSQLCQRAPRPGKRRPAPDGARLLQPKWRTARSDSAVCRWTSSRPAG